jgi:hypothetical protein
LTNPVWQAPPNGALVGHLPQMLLPEANMATFEIPAVTTERLVLRAFRPADLDAYAAMQANPEVMRYLVMGRTSTRVEVWRTMATSLGQWALRGYGMWACEMIAGGVFVGSVGIFEPLDWPEPELAYALDQPFWGQVLRQRPWRRRAIGFLPTSRSNGRRASSGRKITNRSASWSGSGRSASAVSSCVARFMNTGCIGAQTGSTYGS